MRSWKLKEEDCNTYFNDIIISNYVTLHIFSQIIVICLRVKTGLSPFFVGVLVITWTLLGELGPANEFGDARSKSAIMGSGDPGLAGGDLLVEGNSANCLLLRSLFNSSRR